LANRKRDLHERIEQYERIVEELGDELDRSDPAEGPFWTAAVGAEEVADLLAERIAAVDSTVVVAATPARGPDIDAFDDRVAAELERALERGVDVLLLM
jgi:sugar-specific transcriptional regulator TrmB